MFKPGEILQKAEEIVDALASSDEGKFSLDHAEEDLAIFLREKGMDVYDQAAKNFIARLDRSRRPKFHQPGLFDSECWIPIGKKRRIKLGKARRQDMIAWDGIIAENTKRYNEFATLSRQYIKDRLQYMTNGQTIDELNLSHPFDKNVVYTTPEWKRLRDEVLGDANHVCADCGGFATQAHHTTYEYGVICHKKFLVALCEDCHKKRHGIDDIDF